jgi:hypothetical protein
MNRQQWLSVWGFDHTHPSVGNSTPSVLGNAKRGTEGGFKGAADDRPSTAASRVLRSRRASLKGPRRAARSARRLDERLLRVSSDPSRNTPSGSKRADVSSAEPPSYIDAVAPIPLWG